MRVLLLANWPRLRFRRHCSRVDRMNTSALGEVTHELSAATLFHSSESVSTREQWHLKRSSALICKMPAGEKS